MALRGIARRRFVSGTAGCRRLLSVHRSCAAPMPQKLAVGLWDHWVPGANAAMETLIKQWAEKEKVDVQIDFITTQGNKLLLTVAAEAQAETRPRHPCSGLFLAGALRRATGSGQ